MSGDGIAGARAGVEHGQQGRKGRVRLAQPRRIEATRGTPAETADLDGSIDHLIEASVELRQGGER